MIEVFMALQLVYGPPADTTETGRALQLAVRAVVAAIDSVSYPSNRNRHVYIDRESFRGALATSGGELSSTDRLDGLLGARASERAVSAVETCEGRACAIEGGGMVLMADKVQSSVDQILIRITTRVRPQADRLTQVVHEVVLRRRGGKFEVESVRAVRTT